MVCFLGRRMFAVYHNNHEEGWCPFTFLKQQAWPVVKRIVRTSTILRKHDSGVTATKKTFITHAISAPNPLGVVDPKHLSTCHGKTPSNNQKSNRNERISHETCDPPFVSSTGYSGYTAARWHYWAPPLSTQLSPRASIGHEEVSSKIVFPSNISCPSTFSPLSIPCCPETHRTETRIQPSLQRSLPQVIGKVRSSDGRQDVGVCLEVLKWLTLWTMCKILCFSEIGFPSEGKQQLQWPQWIFSCIFRV